ncbi:rhodanese-like domain-containing protein [Bradyrhizobium sp. Pear76]|uniref:rhodanese-like domain-containing protein n=1 Tax=Bradyrhizobium oropedii TaxID=1571201 RepID=UPI001E326146|nr:rhodanese-like domain-containing protein [Bradyrhizobium oropedii]MCC8967107.1 rhodanese-like domain-containing protein [Bradyrhizobium oropedii]
MSSEKRGQPGEGVHMLSPDDAKRALEQGGVSLIDVGEPWQLRERGTIAGARNISHEEIATVAASDPALGDRAQPIILTCGGGGKASRAAQALREIGFADVAVIQGGCRGWQAAGHEMVAYPAAPSDKTAGS